MAQMRNPRARRGDDAETLAIARVAGADPQVSAGKQIDGAWRVGHRKTSMLQDLEAGRPLEIDAIIRAVADLGGVEPPALRHVHAAVGLPNRDGDSVRLSQKLPICPQWNIYCPLRTE